MGHIRSLTAAEAEHTYKISKQTYTLTIFLHSHTLTYIIRIPQTIESFGQFLKKRQKMVEFYWKERKHAQDSRCEVTSISDFSDL